MSLMMADDTELDQHVVFGCDCHSLNHMVAVDVFHWQDSEPDFCVSVTADLHLTWYQRLWLAIQYVIGYKPLEWHDVMLKSTDVDQLADMIKHYKHLNTVYRIKHPTSDNHE